MRTDQNKGILTLNWNAWAAVICYHEHDFDGVKGRRGTEFIIGQNSVEGASHLAQLEICLIGRLDRH